MADALTVERLVDFAHRGLPDRVAQASGGEDRHADVFRVGAYGFGEHGSPLQATPHARIGWLEIVEDDGNDRGQGIEAAPPKRNAEAVVERQVVRHRGLEVALERGLQDVIRELRMPGDLLEGAVLHPGLGGAFVLLAHSHADARKVVDEEIHPVVRGDLDQDVGPGGLDAPAELGQRARELALIRGLDILPSADDERGMARGEHSDQSSHGSTSPPRPLRRSSLFSGNPPRTFRRPQNRNAEDTG